MNRSIRHFRNLSAGVLAAFLLVPGGAEACEAPKLTASGESYEGASGFLEDPNLLNMMPSHAASCPQPACSDASCLTFNSATPFVRNPGLESSPIFNYAGCFGIAKRDANFYVKLSMDGPGGGGMFRHTSTDGGITWQPGAVVLKSDAGWFTGMKCPDPMFLDDPGNMVVYFKASAASGGGIARAVSTDDGLSWVVPESGPVLKSDGPGFFVDNPSVIRRSKHEWMMAYTQGCVGEIAPFQLAETHLAVSRDGIRWHKLQNGPALVPGPCGDFDHGAIANPVLVNDPDDEDTIHLFYTGAGWKLLQNGVGTTRGCAKIGHAISTDRGQTWCKTGVVLDHPPASVGAWDNLQYMVSSYTIEPGDKIRMYYWAAGSTGHGLGVAEAPWPLPGCGPLQGDEVGYRTDLTDGLSDDATFGASGRPIPALQLHPNPSLGRTTISHNLQSTTLEGPGSMKVFDVSGREVASVWNGRLEAAPSQMEWDGNDASGNSVANGRYLIRLESAGAAIATDWVTVLR